MYSEYKEFFKTIILSIGSLVGVESVDKILFNEQLQTFDLIIKIIIQVFICVLTAIYLIMKIRYYKRKK